MSDFVERWAQAWGAPTPDKIRGLTDPDIALRWPGMPEPIQGADAWAARVSGTLQRFPDLKLTVTGHARNEDLLFISWQASATVDGKPLTWEGIDRMQLRDEVVVASLVAFDTAPLRAV